MTQALSATIQPDANKPQQSGGGVKETIEQILVAFILAFVFRCYIVEAFVIPTGSMAPTLLGAHMDFRCGDCGYSFNVNYSAPESASGSMAIPSVAAETYPLRCPNCGYRLPLYNPADPDNDATAASVQYGDRILVQKYIYLLHEPQRWDVVVFKNPDKPAPGSDRYQDNYIKRLIGLPNETLMVLDGDVYVSKSESPVEDLAPGDFTVQTKTPAAQDALWRIVYDNDYRPRGLTRTYTKPVTISDPRSPGGARAAQQLLFAESAWRQPWVSGGTGWDTSGQTFTFDGLNQAASALQYDTMSMPEKFPLTDWLAYDMSWQQAGPRSSNHDGFMDEGYGRDITPLNNVSDVKIAVSYTRLAGNGALSLSTSKRSHVFTAAVLPDRVRLEMRVGDAAPVPIGESTRAVGIGQPARVELINADYRVSVRVDGEEILSTTPEQFAPDIASLLKAFESHEDQPSPRIRIEAADQRCELAHVQLWRDIYYLNRLINGRVRWAIPSNFPAGDASGRLMRLGPDEFFVLGDNSMLSHDGRAWEMAVALEHERLAVAAGRVPRRFLLGRAFFVYWPAGFAPVSSLPAFVPNFGEMRFIH